jgi:dihydropyrimidine dehydrogenase (NAD+) subunit PreA
LIGQDPGLTREVVKLTKEGCNIPIMVKLPGSVTPSTLNEVATAGEKAGADAIYVTNTILGLLGIDIETGIPTPFLENTQGNPETIFSGISAPAIVPIALRCGAQICACVGIPVSGIGEVTDWKSAMEFVMVGARTLQCATAPLLFGYNIVWDILSKLQVFMKRQEYASIEDFRGVSLKYLGNFSNLKQEPQLKASLEPEKCTVYSRCITACDAGGSSAIKIDNKGYANVKTHLKAIKVLEEQCCGCARTSFKFNSNTQLSAHNIEY